MASPDHDLDAVRDIDMDRVVIDPEYRRRIVGRLRRDRLLAEARRPKLADEMLAMGAGDED